MSYKPTVYEQIVTDYLNNKKLDYNNYKDELAVRGWKDKRYFDAYVEDIKYIKDVMNQTDYKNAALDFAKDYLSEKNPSLQDVKDKISSKGWGNIYNEDIDNISLLLSQIKDKETVLNYLNNKESANIDATDKSIMDKIKDTIYNHKFNLRQAADVVKNNHPTEKENVLYFALTDAEKKLILDAEDKGSFKHELENNEIIKYDGYKREIKVAPANNLPQNTDAFVIFSGHPGSAEPAIEAWFEDLKRTGQPKKMIFLGLYDNQGNTDFSNKNLKYNTGSEVEMYVRYCRDAGIPEKVINECLVTPKDTSTEENTALLAEIRNKYFAKDKDVNFAMFGYPAYQKRIASEFAFQFQIMEDNKTVAPTNFIMPVTKTEKNADYRYLSYDNLNGIAQDIIVGNCLAHPYRVSAGGRFDSKLGAYPEELKPLLPISLVYSYPNVANELAGTDTQIGTMMKLLRAVQHKTYGWEDASKVDVSMSYNNLHLKRRLAQKGLLSHDMLANRTTISANEISEHFNKVLAKTSAKQRETEAAKIVLGEKVHPKNIEAWLNFNKKQKEK